jgi:hypothetical protein
MTDEERDQAIQIVAKIALEAQTWVAALKEILVLRGLTTDEEFSEFVAAAENHSGDGKDDAGS